MGERIEKDTKKRGDWSWWDEDEPESGAAEEGPAENWRLSARMRGRDKSLSGWWSERWGGVKRWFSGDNTRTIRLVEALQTMRRIGGIVYGREVAFTWYKNNSIDALDLRFEQGASEAVTLDPGPLDLRELDAALLGWSEGHRVDAVVGDALVQASRQLHVAPTLDDAEDEIAKVANAIAYAPALPGVPHARFDAFRQAGCSLYDAISHLYSGRKVTDAFPGYTGYLEIERDYSHREEVKKATERQVLLGLSRNSRDLAAATVVAIWKTLRPSDPLDVPLEEEVEQITTEIADQLRSTAASAESTKQLVGAVKDALDKMRDFSVEESCGKEIAEANDRMRASGGSGRSAVNPRIARQVEQLVSLEYELVDPEEHDEFRQLTPHGRKDIRVYSIRAKPDRFLYEKALDNIRPLLEKTRAALSFRNEQEAMDELGLRRGHIDEGGLYKIAFGDPRIFARTEIKAQPKVHFGILVDESGSMRWSANGKPRSQIARESAILLANAVAGIKGVKLSVWGHTADDPDLARDGAVIFRYIEAGAGSLDALGSITDRYNNADGFAIAFCARRILETTEPDETGILVVLCDGHPAADGYGGEPAERHVRDVCDLARRRGLQIYAIGMGYDLDEKRLERQFGADGFVIVRDAGELPQAISRILVRSLREGRVA